ncbi:MAG: glycosyltransferase family 39 protein [Planctomycetes bacterium]|nr:glycosyltransferase family 39 protein [Planctomycetota bacterium]
MRRPLEDRPFWQLIAPGLGFAAIAGLVALDQGLWFDEIWTLVDFGRLPFGELLTTYGSDNNHPLYTLLARLALLAFGEVAWALRLPAFIFGLLAIVELGRLGRLVLDPVRGALAATILAVAGPQIWFSTNARGYSALLFFSLLATRHLVASRVDSSRRLMLKQALALALGSWVHATMIFVALGQLVGGALLLRDLRRRRVVGAVLLAGLFSLLFHLPILGEMYRFLLGGGGHEKVTSSWNSPLWMLRETAARLGLPLAAALAAAVPALVFGLVGLRRLAATDRMLPAMVLLPALIGGGCMIGLGRNLWPRFFYFELGFAILVAVAALVPGPRRDEGRGRRFWRLAAGSALIVGSALTIVTSRPFMPKQDFAAAASFADTLPAGRVVTVGLARMPCADYLHRPYLAVDDRAELESLLDGRDLWVLDTLPIWLEERRPELARLIADRGRIERRFPGSLGGGSILVWRLR